MPNPQSETDELKTLQQEVAALRAEKEGRSPKAKTATKEESQTPPAKKRRSRAASSTTQTSEAAGEENVTEASPQDSALEEQTPEEEDQVPDLDETLHDLVTHIDSVAKGLQEATKEHPSLGLMAAFTTGIVVGYLLTRRNV